jgi:GT2 family glycosyltransferase
VARIVIPVFNQAFFTRICLMALEREQDAAEVVVVDNGSTDGTPELLADWVDGGPGRSIIRKPENLGFATACNAGAAVGSTSVLVFLNNDTFVLEGWQSSLIRPLLDPSVAITGSRLLYPDGRVQHAGLAFDASGPRHAFLGLPGDTPIVLEERDCQAVTGASLAIRRVTFEQAGGFDEGFRNSFEDVDLCLRVRESGGRVVYVPDSVAYHFEGMTEAWHAPVDVRNHERFLLRWRGRFDLDLADLEAQARAAGWDPAAAVPRREMLDYQRRLEAELADLRMLLKLRSVRYALWAQRLLRRLVHSRDA